MNRIYSLVLVLFLVGSASHAQNTRLSPDDLSQEKWYNSLEEAMAEPEKVYKLSLKDQNIKTFPLEVFAMPNLQVLILNRNKIKELPEEIGQLKNLEVLDLYKNDLSNVPESLGRLRNLKELYLAHNRLLYVPSTIRALKQLSKLDISYNQLSLSEINYVRKNLPETKITY